MRGNYFGPYRMKFQSSLGLIFKELVILDLLFELLLQSTWLRSSTDRTRVS